MSKQRFFCFNVLNNFIESIPENGAIEYLVCFYFCAIKVNLDNNQMIILIYSDIPAY